MKPDFPAPSTTREQVLTKSGVLQHVKIHSELEKSLVFGLLQHQTQQRPIIDE